MGQVDEACRNILNRLHGVCEELLRDVNNSEAHESRPLSRSFAATFFTARRTSDAPIDSPVSGAST
jgi:hypothetical protein